MNSAEFLKAYLDLHGAAPEPILGDFDKGTIGAGVAAYLSSKTFLTLSEKTQQQRARPCLDIQVRYGKAPLSGLKERHIRQDLSALEGNPANHRLKAWRGLFAFWKERGFTASNEALKVERRKVSKSDGHPAWTRDDFAAFRKAWPIGTAQRLAFELMYRTCASIGDACKLSPEDVADGWLSYVRGKSNSAATCPFSVPGPAWFEATADLAQCLAARGVVKMDGPFILTSKGQPRSAKAAASWFSRAAAKAGVNKTAHGIRKGRAAMFRENGASAEQRMGVLGHETESEASHYSKSADLRRVIEE
jgi:site-specific recombinase XerD